MAKSFTYESPSRHVKYENKWYRVVEGRRYSIKPDDEMRVAIMNGPRNTRMSKGLYDHLLAEDAIRAGSAAAEAAAKAAKLNGEDVE